MAQSGADGRSKGEECGVSLYWALVQWDHEPHAIKNVRRRAPASQSRPISRRFGKALLQRVEHLLHVAGMRAVRCERQIFVERFDGAGRTLYFPLTICASPKRSEPLTK